MNSAPRALETYCTQYKYEYRYGTHSLSKPIYHHNDDDDKNDDDDHHKTAIKQ